MFGFQTTPPRATRKSLRQYSRTRARRNRVRAFETLEARYLLAASLFRINAGGPEVADSPAWTADTKAEPSTYVNAAEAGNQTYAVAATIDMSDASLPSGTPMELFQSERWDPASGAEMQWSFPVTPGQYEVRLFFAEIYKGSQSVGARVFDVSIEDQLKLDDYDVYADVGGYKGVMKSFTVSSDSTLDVEFGHVVENPAIKAIEIVSVNSAPVLAPIDSPSLAVGETVEIPLSASDADAGQSLQITFSGPSFATLADYGDGTGTLTVSPQAGDSGVYTGTVTVTDDGTPSLSDSHEFTITVFAGGAAMYRVNAGGSLISDDADWTADTKAEPSTYVNAAEAGNQTYTVAATIDMSDASIPSGTPVELFQSERWDPASGAEMQWSFPVTPGQYEVKLFFAEIYKGSQAVGARVFDVSIEDQLKLDDYDVYADVGGYKGVMKSFTVSSDSTLDVEFGHVVENPAIKAIEIVSVNSAPVLDPIDSPSLTVGETVEIPLSASDADAGQSLQLTFSGPSFATLADYGDGTGTLTVSPQAGDSGVYTGTVTVTDDGTPSLSDSQEFTITVFAGGAAMYRVNAGGSLISDDADWTADTKAEPSTYVNAAEAGNQTYTVAATIDMSDASIPSGTPMELFQSERWDPAGGAEMQWSFPVTPGQYEVKLFFAEIYKGSQSVGARVFDVSIEDQLKLDDYDVYADVGGYKGVMKSFMVSSDSTLDVEFGHVVENPAIKAIEIVQLQLPNTLVASSTAFDFGLVKPGATATGSMTFTNGGVSGDPDVEITTSTLSGDAAFSATFPSALPIVLAPGESVTASLEFAPTENRSYSGTFTIGHSGTNSPLDISLTGTGSTAVIDFAKSTLAGTSLAKPTSLQFGPDGRLYVAQQNGKINIYDIVRNAENDFAVSATETILSVQQIPNHNDDGTFNPDVKTRLITGLLVAGTAENPVLYVGSSDPRIGAGPSGEDLNLDTNSGIISRLTWNGSSWEKLDLVRGLPRSEENHHNNGMQLDESTNTLYVAMGGNTNMGAPSNNFALLPEYALSAAILSIDLDAIGDTTYDLPTLDDEDRGNELDADGNPTDRDISDPFGGNDGKNQAKLVPGGPVQVHSPGWRNPYDILITEGGQMYSIDNGPNAGWGDIPILEDGVATNQVSEPGVTFGDGLHLIPGAGYYAGHPNPTRASTTNTFNETNPQSPVSADSPAESTYIPPVDSTKYGAKDGSLVVFPESTNGLTEYTATSFDGAMQGDLLSVSYDNSVKRIVLNAAGDQVESATNLFSNVGGTPLDVTTLGDSSPFPGTIWVADWYFSAIVVFEPVGASAGCENDADCDGYTDDDEIANGTNPNSAADVPPDFDGDFTSDLSDDDDDNDQILDVEDAFAIDADNGTTTPIGTVYTWENDESSAGLLGLGFTGLMTNGVDDYLDLYDSGALTAGGAAGVLTIDAASPGTALGTVNTQEQAFQFGFDAASAIQPFVAKTSVGGPFTGITPEAGTEMGFYIGTGDQDNYAKLVISGDDGGTIQFVIETAGVPTTIDTDPISLSNVDFIDLDLIVDPATQLLTAEYRISTAGELGSIVRMSQTGQIPAAWLDAAMAIGITSTDATPDSPVSVTWDFLGVVSDNQGIPPDAFATINKDGGIDASTYLSDTIWIENTAASGGPRITSVTFDSSTTFLPDIVFDPFGEAGDTDAKALTVTTGAAETGYVTPSTAEEPFSGLYQKGYRQMTLDFTEFDPGEIVKFAVDLDPTTIQGLAGKGSAWPGSISGLEMSGMEITINFSDGSTRTGTVFAKAGSLGEGNATIAPHTSAAPAIQVIGVSENPATVYEPQQTVRISGTPGDAVRVLVTEAALEPVDQTLYDVDPYEANRVRAVTHLSGTITADGYVDIPVTLTNDFDQGGLNYISAVVEIDGRSGAISEVLVLKLEEAVMASSVSSFQIAEGDGHDISTDGDDHDVNADGIVSPIDALMVINTLNRQRADGDDDAMFRIRGRRVDVNRDGRVTPLDALLIVNRLNRRTFEQPTSTKAADVLLYPPSLEEEEDRLVATDVALESWPEALDASERKA